MLRRYVEREFIELLRQSPLWKPLGLAVDQIHLTTNSVWLSIGSSGGSGGSLKIVMSERSGWLVAGVAEAGWTAPLAATQRRALRNAVVGLYKSAGIDLVREQIESEFPPPMPPYDFSDNELMLWPDETTDAEVAYDLREGPWIAPRSAAGKTAAFAADGRTAANSFPGDAGRLGALGGNLESASERPRGRPRRSRSHARPLTAGL